MRSGEDRSFARAAPAFAGAHRGVISQALDDDAVRSSARFSTS